MKLLIGSVVALLCVQIIQASVFNFQFGNQCQRDLRSYKRDVKAWFGEFQEQHNIAHDDYEVIKEICVKLTGALEAFSSATFGSDQSSEQTECQIAEFFEAFYQMRLDALEAITHLRYYCDVLLNMADDFKCGRKLVCISDTTCSACEAEINSEKCELVAFYDALASFGAEAKAQLDGLLQSCDGLGLQARSFACQNSPSCNGKGCGCSAGQRSTNLLDDFKTFLTPFIVLHDVSHIQLTKIGDICDLLTGAIETWLKKY